MRLLNPPFSPVFYHSQNREGAVTTITGSKIKKAVVGVDKFEFALRLIAIVVVFFITLADILYWKIDHVLILYLGVLIGLLAGIRLRPIEIKPLGDDDG